MFSILKYLQFLLSIYITNSHRNCIDFNFYVEIYGVVGTALCIIHAHVHRHARRAHRASIAIAGIDSRLDVGEVDERYSLPSKSRVPDDRVGA